MRALRLPIGVKSDSRAEPISVEDRRWRVTINECFGRIFVRWCCRKVLLMRVNYAIVFVSDMKRSVSFYRDVLGLPLKFESPGWTEFSTDGATLALHASAVSNSAVDDPKQVPAGRCRPGLCVPDLDEFHQRMMARNVVCVQEPKEVFGVRVAQYADPDGLTISVGADPPSR
jgi:lactoylglutathione lyase